MRFIEQRISKVCAFTLLFTFIISTTVFAAALPTQTVYTQGNSDHVIVSNRVNSVSTDQDLYQMEIKLQPPVMTIEPLPAYVTFLLDWSGSMNRPVNPIFGIPGSDDIWNSQTNSWITREEAINIAMANALQVLKDSGNQNVFVNVILYHGSNTIDNQTNGFKPLLSAPNTLSNQFQLQSGAGKAFASLPVLNVPVGGGNPIGIGMSSAYREIQQGIQSGFIPTNSTRYIIIMGDGDDSETMLTQQYAAAFKAPLDVAYLQSPIGTPTSVAGVSTGGLGGTIWSIIMGTEVAYNQNWRSNFFWSPSRIMSTDWSLVANGGQASPSTAGINTGKGPASLVAAATHLHHYPESGFSDFSNALEYYQVNASNPLDRPINSGKLLSQIDKTHFYFSNHLYSETPNGTIANHAMLGVFTGTDSLSNVFEGFAEAATTAGAGSGIQVTAQVDSDYTIVKLPGKDWVELVTNDNYSALRYESEITGNNVDWKVNQLVGGLDYKIIYYVRKTQPAGGASPTPSSTLTPTPQPTMIPLNTNNITPTNTPEVTGSPLHDSMPLQRNDETFTGISPKKTSASPKNSEEVLVLHSENVAESTEEMPLTGIYAIWTTIGVAIVLVMTAVIIRKKTKNKSSILK